jgi:lysophospholipase L1-like esterase
MRKSLVSLLAASVCIALISPTLLRSVQAQEGNLLGDVTGDGSVALIAFGDSITYGVGDVGNPGDYVETIDDSGSPRGYPKRLSSTISAGVSNAGSPGERFLYDGFARLVSFVTSGEVDTVVFMEGTNDAFNRIEGRDYRIALQRVINVARAEGKNILLNTLPPPVATNAPLAAFTTLYSSIIRDLGVINSVPVADVEQKFRAACPDLDSCQLYNIPEGLHPNTAGYDAIAQVVAEALGG